MGAQIGYMIFSLLWILFIHYIFEGSSNAYKILLLISSIAG